MATGDLYELTDVQILEGQQVLNVYHYTQVAEATVGTNVVALQNAWTTFILVPLVLVQSVHVEHVGYKVVNLDNPDEFGLQVATATGNVSGEALPPFCAWSFRLNRATRLVRNGQKRIGGVPESFNDGGVATGAALTLLPAVAIAMGALITDTISGASFTPRIVHKATEAGPGGSPPATPRADYAVASAEYTRISTQNTRKFGRGA